MNKKIMPLTVLGGALTLATISITHHILTTGFSPNFPASGGEEDEEMIATSPEMLLAAEAWENDGTTPRPAKVSGSYNASARIEVKKRWDFFGSASFLYWQAREEGLDFGISAPASINSASEVVNIDFEYKPGFKVAAGMNIDHDKWSLMAVYTWLHSNVEKHTTAPEGGSIHPTWEDPTNFSSVSHQEAKWDLHVSFLDLQMMRAYYVGTQLTFQPNLGLRLGWIDQHFHVHYDSATFPMTIKNKSDSWGIGPIFGLNTSWLLGRGTRLIGDINGSILYTNYRTHLEKSSILDPTVLGVNVKNHIHYLRPAVETALGFGWGTYCCKDQYHFDLSAAYNFNVYWNQNMMRWLKDVEAVQVSDGMGDLYLHGLTATARFDF